MPISPKLPVLMTFAIAIFAFGLPFVALGKAKAIPLFQGAGLFALIQTSSAAMYYLMSNYSFIDILLLKGNPPIWLSKLLLTSSAFVLPLFALSLCAIGRVLWLKFLTNHSSGTPNGAPKFKRWAS